MAGDPFATIAQRWEDHRRLAGVAELPVEKQQAMRLVFYGGFMACLEAMNELGNRSDEVAMHLLQGLHVEARSFTIRAITEAMKGNQP